MTYEIIHETYNICHGEPTSEILEAEAESPDAYIKLHVDKKASVERIEAGDGSTVYNVLLNGQKERYTITAI